MDLEQEIRRLKVRTTVLTVIVVIGVVNYGFSKFLQYMQSWDKLSVSLTRDTISLGPTNDGPFVVTHIVSYGGGTGDQRTATLPAPIAIIDSEGASVDVSKLQWRNYRGEIASAPTGQRLEALYFRPERAKQRH